jgi:hypothetical protein
LLFYTQTGGNALDKFLRVLMFLTLGIGAPWYLAVRFNWANQALEINAFYGVAVIFGVAFVMMGIFMYLHQHFYRCQPSEEVSRGLAIVALISYVLTSQYF